MDESEDPLGKISRQLSELAATPSSPVTTNGTEWTQFSGISPQHTHNTDFRNLYTWNSLQYRSNLQDFQPVSSTVSDIGNLRSVPSNYNSHVLNQHNDYIPQNSYDWSADTQQTFSVSGDLGGRFVETDHIRTANKSADSQRKAYSMQKSASLQEPSVFHGDDFVGHSNFNKRGDDECQTSFSTAVPLLERSVSDIHSRITTNSECYLNHTMADCFSADDSNVLRDDNMPTPPLSQKKLSTSKLQSNLVKFDPSTPPPPLFPVHSSGTESLMPEKPCLSSHSQIRSDYSSLQSMSGINLDLGTDIEPGSRKGTKRNENICDENLYVATKKKWNATPVGVSELKRNTSVNESAKPSYSDIAKTPKGGNTKVIKTNIPHLPEFDPKTDVKDQPKKSMSRKEQKPVHSQVRRTSSGSKSWQRSLQSSDEHAISSSSGYSLDSFDDPVLTPGSSSENLVQSGKLRHNSGSSGSSAGIAEDMTIGSAASIAKEHRKNTTLKASKNSSKLKADSLFFDPRRIFQSKNTNKSKMSQKNKSATTSNPDSMNSDMVLNNGKPSTSSSSKLYTSSHQHDYINNDLRDANKLTNQAVAETSHRNNKREELRNAPGKKAGFRHSSRKDRRKNPDSQRSASLDKATAERNHFNMITEHIDLEKIEEWCSLAFDQMKVWGNLLLNSLTNLTLYMLGVILYLASGGVQISLIIGLRVWAWIKHRFLHGWSGSGTQDWRSREYPRRRLGLEENILLPNTGEDAMKRLLACKGKDPYSILGLRADSSDEDIKRYYRKQAVLVHPDKNQEPGAEEAFKVLGHAFEMIGDPSKRKKYDGHTQEANKADEMRKFADMLSELQTKLQEAANTMHCDNCGGKHRRVPVDRPFYSARFCQRCNVHHSAKEGDVWAESKMLGFYWHYYALMEGHVFDITEWMKCHKEFFQHMKANTHGVSYRIATDGNKKNRHHHQSGHGDANLEDIINRLFNKVSQAAGDGPTWGGSAGKSSDMSWPSQNSSTPTTSCNAKKNSRRRKKR